MKRSLVLLTGLVAIPLAINAGELYRWVDSKGKVHYGDQPAPANDAVMVEPLRFDAADTASEGLSYETRRAQQNFPVTLYIGENCAEACKMARELLTKRGIPFTEKILRTKEEIDTFKALSGGDTVPSLSVGKSYQLGFLASAWQSELDIAGYPKLAPYRLPSVLPASAPASAPVAASQVAPASQVEPAYPVAP